MFESTIHRGILLTIVTLIICIFGILAAFRIPVQMIPDLEIRVIRVETLWPGATPQDVEKEILIEQEDYLRNIPGLERMISIATTDRARIELEFPFGIDINEALIRVNNALSQVSSYPENVDEPRIYTSSFSSNSFMFFRIEPLPGNPKDLDMEFMRDFIDDNVRTRLERVPGVSEVPIRGGAERQIQIFVDPVRLAERGLTFAELRAAIRDRNLDVSGGDLESGKRRYLLRTIGRFQTLDQLGDLIIKREGDSIIRLKDVANLQLDHARINSKTFMNGQPVIIIMVRREIGSNVIKIKNQVMPVVEQINKNVLAPAGMVMNYTSDDVRYVVASIKNVWRNLAIGAVLATLVMFLFLRSIKATLVGIMGIPICTIAAFLGLFVAGRTINVISLAGVAFAIGMTLDNTIVVLESIERERSKGLDRFEAAVSGVKKVWTAVFASTMTTILVFAPVIFIKEEAGQLYSDIAIAVSASILISMLVAITVVPTASSRISFGATGNSIHRRQWFRHQFNHVIGWIVGGKNRRLLCMVIVVIITAAAIIKLTPPAEYLPEGEEYKSFTSMIAPAGYNLGEMTGLAHELSEYFANYLDDDPNQFIQGETEVPAVAYFFIWSQAQLLRIISESKAPNQIDALMDAIDDKIREYPGMRSFTSRGSIITSNDSGTRSISIDISGADLDSIYKTADTIYNRAYDLFNRPRIKSEPDSLILGQPLVEIRPHWERAAELGVSAEDIGYAVSVVTDGAYVDEFFLGDDKIDMFLYSNTGRLSNINEINNIPLYINQGTIVPMNAVADIVETIDTDTIRRVNSRRTVTVNIIPPRNIPLETGVHRVQKELIEDMRLAGEIPTGVTLDIIGASDQLDATRASLLDNFFIAIILCYLLLVAIFNHWGMPLIIMTTVPLGIAGGITGLWLLNVIGAGLPAVGLTAIYQPFDMITMLGFLILVGTVVNNPILIVDRAITNLREENMDPETAVKSAVDSRLRPIMMSMITTVCGLAPLVFIPGAGTELYRGVGAIVLFGLFFATLVTLLFLPPLIVTVLKWRRVVVKGEIKIKKTV